MGKKITQYTNNVSVNPDNNSVFDLSEKTGLTTYESRKWTLTAFKTWVNSWVVASSIAWSNITGKPTTIAGYGITDAIDGNGASNRMAIWSDSNTLTYSDNLVAIDAGYGVIQVKSSLTAMSMYNGYFNCYSEDGSSPVTFELKSINNTNNPSQIMLRRTRGTLSSQSFEQLNDKIGEVVFTGYGFELASIINTATENHDASNSGNKLEFFIIKNATNTPFNALTLDSDGKVKISNAYKLPLTDGTSGQIPKTDGAGVVSWANFPCEVKLAVSDENTALTTGAGKITFRMPYAMTVTEVRASLVTAQTSGSIFTVDVNESGVSILSTKLTIDNTEKTSVTATTPAVISDSSLADDTEITIDIDQIGDGTAKGLKVLIKGYRAI